MTEALSNQDLQMAAAAAAAEYATPRPEALIVLALAALLGLALGMLCRLSRPRGPRCHECGGRGTIPDYGILGALGPSTCPSCKGTGVGKVDGINRP